MGTRCRPLLARVTAVASRAAAGNRASAAVASGSSLHTNSIKKSPKRAFSSKVLQQEQEQLQQAGAEEEDFLVDILLGNVEEAPTRGTITSTQATVSVCTGLTSARLGDLVLLTGRGEEEEDEAPDGVSSQGVVLKLEKDRVTVGWLGSTAAASVGAGAGSGVRLAEEGEGIILPELGSALGCVFDVEGNILEEWMAHGAAPEEQEGQGEEAGGGAAAAFGGTAAAMHLMSSRVRQVTLNNNRSVSPCTRGALTHRLRTSLKAVDVLRPLMRGQSVSITGEEGTGKTTLALDIIASQQQSEQSQQRAAGAMANTDTEKEEEEPCLCVLVLVGGSRAAAQRAVGQLRARGAMDHTAVIVATQDEATPASMYLSPQLGLLMAEQHRLSGGHALLVIDDIGGHSAATQEVTARSWHPATNASLYGPLADAAAQQALSRGGGSMTTMLLGGGPDIAVMSDCSIELDSELAASRAFPAIDVCQGSHTSAGGSTLPSPLRELAASVSRKGLSARKERQATELAQQFGIDSMDETGLDGTRGALFEQAMQGTLGVQEEEGKAVDDDSALVLLVTLLSGRVTSALQRHKESSAVSASSPASAALLRRIRSATTPRSANSSSSDGIPPREVSRWSAAVVEGVRTSREGRAALEGLRGLVAMRGGGRERELGDMLVARCLLDEEQHDSRSGSSMTAGGPVALQEQQQQQQAEEQQQLGEEGGGGGSNDVAGLYGALTQAIDAAIQRVAPMR